MDPIVTTAKLAEVLGIEVDEVQRLTKAGDLKPEGRGKYKLGESIRAYIEAIAGLKDVRRLNEELLHEKVLLTRAQRKRAELEQASLEERIAKTRAATEGRGVKRRR